MTDTITKLRLIMWEACNRSCPGCCNKDFNLKALPQVESFKQFETVMLTGGEPMLKPKRVQDTAIKIKNENPQAQVIVYTAHVQASATNFIDTLEVVDGMTITLHEPEDTEAFEVLYGLLNALGCFDGKNMRLNVFSGVPVPNVGPTWNVKTNIEWIKDCPLPSGEVLMRM